MIMMITYNLKVFPVIAISRTNVSSLCDCADGKHTNPKKVHLRITFNETRRHVFQMLAARLGRCWVKRRHAPAPTFATMRWRRPQHRVNWFAPLGRAVRPDWAASISVIIDIQLICEDALLTEPALPTWCAPEPGPFQKRFEH
jgi:hypothetical protein